MEPLSERKLATMFPQQEHVTTTDDLFGPIISPDRETQDLRESGGGSLQTTVGTGRFAGEVHISADTVAVSAMSVPVSIHIPDLQLDSRTVDSDCSAVPNPALLRPLEPDYKAPDVHSLSVNLQTAQVRRDSEGDAAAAAASSALTPVPESPRAQPKLPPDLGEVWRLPLVEERKDAPISISTAPVDRFSPRRPGLQAITIETDDVSALSAAGKTWQSIAEECGVALDEAEAEIEDPMESFVLTTTRADDKDWLDFLTAQFCIATREDGSRIDKTLRHMQDHRKTGVSADDNSLIWRLLPNPHFHLVLLVMFVIYAYLFVRDGIVLTWGEHETASGFRFKVVELRDKNAPPTTANMGDVGVHFSDCTHTPKTRDDDGLAVSLAFSRKVKMNEWYFVTDGDDPALDPVSFEVEMFNARGEIERLAAPDFHNSLARAGSRSYRWHAEPPRERNREVVMPLRPPLLFSVSQFMVYGLIAAGNLAALILCRRRNYLQARRTVALTMGLVGLTSWVVCLALFSMRRWRLGLMWTRTVVATSLLTPSVGYEGLEFVLIPCLILAGFGYLVLLTSDLFSDGKTAGEIFVLHEPYICVLAMVVGVWLAARRRSKRQQVRLAVAKHKRDFDAAWQSELANMGDQPPQLHELRELVRDVRYRHRHARRPQQRLAKQRRAEKERTFHSNVFGVLRKGSYNTPSLRDETSGPPVESLDQLYAQARCCLPLLRDVVKRAALVSGGSFPLTMLKEQEDPDEKHRSSVASPLMRSSRTDVNRASSLRSSVGRASSLRSSVGRASVENEQDKEQEQQSLARKFVRWDEAVDDAEYSSAILWTPLKPERRAVEKVVQKYRGEVSRLLDVCRETIVLDSVADAMRCLQALSLDERIKIERVKNSLDNAVSAEDSAGFRSVLVNFRVSTPETRALGCDGHICEVLLLLKSISNSLSEEGHEKYLNFRRHMDSKEFLHRVSEWGACWQGCFTGRPQHGLTPDGAQASFFESFRRVSVVGSRRGSLPSRRGSLVSEGPWRRRASVPSIESADPHTHAANARAGSIRRASLAEASNRRGRRRSSLAQVVSDFSKVLTSGIRGNGGQHSSSSKALGPRMLQIAPDVDGAGSFGHSSAQASAAEGANGNGNGDHAAGALVWAGHTPIGEARSVRDSSPDPVSPPTAATGRRRRMRTWQSAKSDGSTAPSVDDDNLGAMTAGGAFLDSSGRQLPRVGSRTSRRGGARSDDGDTSVEDVIEPLRGQRHGAWYSLLQQVYYERTTQTGGRLDDRAKDLSHAVSNAERFSVFETSFPIAAAMSKRWFPRVVLLLGVVYLVAVAIGGVRIHLTGRLEAARLRFRPLSLRDFTRDPAEAQVAELGLMDGECLVALGEGAGGGWPREFVVGSDGGAVPFNGFYFQVWDGDRALDPMLMALDRWESDQEGWAEVGDSSLSFSVSGHQQTAAKQGSRPGVGPPAEDNAVVTVDLRSSYFVWLQIVWADLLRGLTWVGLAVAAFKQKYRWGQPVLVIGLSLSGVCVLSGAAGQAAGGVRWGGVLHWLMAALALGMALGMGLRPQWFIEIVLGTGSGAIVIYAIDDALGKSGGEAWVGPERISSFVLVVIGACLFVLRWRARREAEAQIQDDLSKYEQAWREVGQDLESIQQIENIVGTLPTKASGHCVQRYVRSKVEEPRKIRRWIFSDGKKLKKKVIRTATLFRTSSVTAQIRNWRHNRRQSNAGASRSSSGVSNMSLQELAKSSGMRRMSSGRVLSRTGSTSAIQATPTNVAASRRNSGSPGTSPLEGLGPHRSSLYQGSTPHAAIGTNGTPGPSAGSLLLRPDAADGAELTPLAGPGAGLGGDEAETPTSGHRRGRRNSSMRSETSKARASRRVAVFKEREGGDTGEVAGVTLPEGAAVSKKEGGHMFSRWTTQEEPQTLHPPVESLDQLYAQATGVQPLLKFKVQAWALASNGMFCVQPRPTATRSLRDSHGPANEFERWEVLRQDPDADKIVKWGKLKNPDRAIEKLVRSYEGKASRLLDLCRQSIAFTSLQDLATCLETIADDEQVSIVSVKNRLSHNYDAKSHSLGYRDLNINLRFTNPLAVKLCIHLHVCEVQLLLTPFAKLKSSAGHKRYVAFRNARGK